MKEMVLIGFNCKQDEWARGARFLEAIGREDWARSPKRLPGYSFKVSPEEVEGILKEAERFGFPTDRMVVRKERIYSKKELLSAELLSLVITKEKGYSGMNVGNMFDFSSACPECGTGAKHITPVAFFPQGAHFRNDAIFSTYSGDTLISTTVAKFFQENGVTGLEFGEVVSFKKKEVLPWFEMRISNQLPPMAQSSRGIIRDEVCPVCGRNGYFNTLKEPREIHYQRKAVSKVLDFNITWEYYGYSDRTDFRFFARPAIIIRPKILQLFLTLRVRGVQFEPVFVDE